jgi:2-amino-4-hydroxy-6-hydroxymethyldihydropteridine diphosphokinase
VNGTGPHFLLGLGSNLGDRATTLAAAIAGLDELPRTKVVAISPAVDSDPVGFPDQPNFLNLCLAVCCELEPGDLLRHTLRLENALGRVRSAQRNGPRTVDIDLLFWTGGPVETPELTLPHPRWKDRGFVTIPLGYLLHAPTLASDPRWDWLRDDIPLAGAGAAGCRPWPGSTPWLPIAD